MYFNFIKEIIKKKDSQTPYFISIFTATCTKTRLKNETEKGAYFHVKIETNEQMKKTNNLDFARLA